MGLSWEYTLQQNVWQNIETCIQEMISLYTSTATMI